MSSAGDSQKLKQLETRKAKLEVQTEELGKETKDTQVRWAKSIGQLNNVRKEIKAMTTRDIVVTEHAILRYAERAMGLDVEEVKGLILTESLIKKVKTLGNGRYPIGNKRKAVVKDLTVVSIV